MFTTPHLSDIGARLAQQVFMCMLMRVYMLHLRTWMLIVERISVKLECCNFVHYVKVI